MQNHVFIFIRNVLGIKTIMRYTLSSITITRHPGTELRVISRRGRRAGGQDTRQTGGGQAGRLRATGTRTEATRRTRHLATHSRFVFVLAFLCFAFFFSLFFSLATCRIWRIGKRQQGEGNEGKEWAEDRK